MLRLLQHSTQSCMCRHDHLTAAGNPSSHVLEDVLGAVLQLA